MRYFNHFYGKYTVIAWKNMKYQLARASSLIQYGENRSQFSSLRHWKHIISYGYFDHIIILAKLGGVVSKLDSAIKIINLISA